MKGRPSPGDTLPFPAFSGFGYHLAQEFPVAEKNQMVGMIADMEVNMAGQIQSLTEDSIKDMLGQGTGCERKMGLPIVILFPYKTKTRSSHRETKNVFEVLKREWFP